MKVKGVLGVKTENNCEEGASHCFTGLTGEAWRSLEEHKSTQSGNSACRISKRKSITNLMRGL